MQKLSSRLILVLILIFLTVGAALIIIFKDKASPLPQGSVTNEQITLSIEQMKKNYQDLSSDIFDRYSQKEQQLPLTADLKASDKSDWIGFLQKINEDLLAIKGIPSEYRDVHLKLVLGFANMGDGLEKDYPAVEKAQSNLNDLVKQYPWLKK